MKYFVPNLWFDDQAENAARFYAETFPNSKIKAITHYGKSGAEVSGKSEGSVLTVEFTAAGQDITALNGGPLFKLTPASSFFVHCESEAEINALWSRLSRQGVALMGLDKYPFAEKFGWVQDQFGVSWQLILQSAPQKIVPFLMFVGAKHGRANEAIEFYVSQFNNSSIRFIKRFGKGQGEPEGAVMHASFTLNGYDFMAMESAGPHQFDFSPAFSIYVNCETQDEIDRLWDGLSAGGRNEQCGWLSDKFGVSWQIGWKGLHELFLSPDEERVENMMSALLKMKKIEIHRLVTAFNAR